MSAKCSFMCLLCVPQLSLHSKAFKTLMNPDGGNYRCFILFQMFVEVWLHHYSLEMYQKLQSPQVKVRQKSPALIFCAAALHGWLPIG